MRIYTVHNDNTGREWIVRATDIHEAVKKALKRLSGEFMIYFVETDRADIHTADLKKSYSIAG